MIKSNKFFIKKLKKVVFIGAFENFKDLINIKVRSTGRLLKAKISILGDNGKF